MLLIPKNMPIARSHRDFQESSWTELPIWSSPCLPCHPIALPTLHHSALLVVCWGSIVHSHPPPKNSNWSSLSLPAMKFNFQSMIFKGQKWGSLSQASFCHICSRLWGKANGSLEEINENNVYKVGPMPLYSTILFFTAMVWGTLNKLRGQREEEVPIWGTSGSGDHLAQLNSNGINLPMPYIWMGNCQLKTCIYYSIWMSAMKCEPSLLLLFSTNPVGLGIPPLQRKKLSLPQRGFRLIK